MPSRTRYPAVLVIQLAHSREITLGDNTLVVASARSLPRQSLRRPAIPPVSHGVVSLSSLSLSLSLVLASLSLHPAAGPTVPPAPRHTRAPTLPWHATHLVNPWGERWLGLVTYYWNWINDYTHARASCVGKPANTSANRSANRPANTTARLAGP